MDNHLAVGSAVAQGKADVGLRIEAAARSYGLDFPPLFSERYDLVIPGQTYRSELPVPLRQMVNSDEFKGYDASQTGSVKFILIS